MPTVQTDSLIFGHSQRAVKRAVKRADRAEQVGQGTDNAERVGQLANPDHSCAVGGGLVSRPEGTSHLTVLPRAAKRSDFVESSPVVTPVPTQDGLDHRVQSVLGDTENSLESQVELTLLVKTC